MKRRTFMWGLPSALVFPEVTSARELKPYTGPKITRLVLNKGERKLYLLSGTTVVESFKVGLGNTAEGHKQFEGDGKTPEGSYFIDRKNPNSKFHLSLGISYPNAKDREFARQAGRSAGGDIFIHGRAKAHRGLGKDWTAGCIAVKDRVIEKIYMMVPLGVQIDIFP